MRSHPLKHVIDGITRRHLSGNKTTFAHYHFEEGAVLPMHQHDHEQITYIVKGCFKMTVIDKEYVLKEGDMLLIPSNLVHGAVALEETVVVEAFSPPREDWESS